VGSCFFPRQFSSLRTRNGKRLLFMRVLCRLFIMNQLR